MGNVELERTSHIGFVTGKFEDKIFTSVSIFSITHVLHNTCITIKIVYSSTYVHVVQEIWLLNMHPARRRIIF
jgi:hypothetical protein